MTNQSVDLNHNIAHCLIHKNHLGYTEITNICTKMVSRVDWSVFDYLGVVAACFTGIVLMVALLGLILSLFFINFYGARDSSFEYDVDVWFDDGSKRHD